MDAGLPEAGLLALTISPLGPFPLRPLHQTSRVIVHVNLSRQRSPRLEPLTMPRQTLWCAFEHSLGGSFPIDYTDEETYCNLKENIRECRKIKRPVTDLWTLYRPGMVVSKVGHFVQQERDSQVQPKSLIIQSCDSSADPDIDIIITMPHKPTFGSDDTSSDTLLDITKEYAKTGTVVFPLQPPCVTLFQQGFKQ